MAPEILASLLVVVKLNVVQRTREQAHIAILQPQTAAMSSNHNHSKSGWPAGTELVVAEAIVHVQAFNHDRRSQHASKGQPRRHKLTSCILSRKMSAGGVKCHQSPLRLPP